MKKIAMFLVAISVLLSSCIVYDTPYRGSGPHRGEHERERGHEHQRDRDRDGVPDREDRRPNDSWRY